MFDALTYDTAKQAVPDLPGFTEAEAMVYRDEPDQRDCGSTTLSGFLGPTGLDTRGLSEARQRAVQGLDSDVRRGLERSFTPVDRLSEASTRRVDGPLQREPATTFYTEAEPDPETEDPVLADLDRVADRAASPQVRLHRTLRKLAHAVNCFGVAYLRVYTPAGRYTDGPSGPELRAADLVEALSHVFVEVVTPDRAAVVTDPATGDEGGVVLLGKAGDLEAAAEVSYPMRGTGDPPLTVHRMIERGKEARDVQEVRLPLRGRALLIEARDPAGAFIDGGLRQIQKALNTASTQKVLVQTEDSLRTRFLLGARPPGEFVTEKDDQGREIEVFQEADWRIGLGDIAHVSGQEVYDPEKLDAAGQPVVTGLSNPRLAEFTAADASRYQADMDARTLQIRERTKQGWVGTTGEAGIAGISRLVAMADYLGDARALAAVIEEAGSTCLEVMADLAAHILGEGGRFYDYQATVECQVTAPPPTSEDQRAAVEMGRAEVWSDDRVMRATGVDDPAAEADAIAREQTDAGRLTRVAAQLAEAGITSPTLNEALGTALLDESGVEIDEATRTAIVADLRTAADRAAQRTALDDLLA